MDAEEAAIAELLAKPDQALARWYKGYMSDEDEDLVLTGIKLPSPDKIGLIFDQWFAQSRTLLRNLLCEKLGYASVTKERRELAEIGIVAVASATLAAANLPLPVDPLSTAVLLYSRRQLDSLCDDGEAAVDDRK